MGVNLSSFIDIASCFEWERKGGGTLVFVCYLDSGLLSDCLSVVDPEYL